SVTGNTNPSLFSAAPSVSSLGTLTYTPVANAFGTATITLKLTDNGGTLNGGVNVSDLKAFTITIDPVNDAPSFDVAPSDTALADAGPRSVPAFAINIAAGPANEVDNQTVSFSMAGNTNPDLFSVAPS